MNIFWDKIYVFEFEIQPIIYFKNIIIFPLKLILFTLLNMDISHVASHSTSL